MLHSALTRNSAAANTLLVIFSRKMQFIAIWLAVMLQNLGNVLVKSLHYCFQRLRNTSHPRWGGVWCCAGWLLARVPQFLHWYFLLIKESLFQTASSGDKFRWRLLSRFLNLQLFYKNSLWLPKVSLSKLRNSSDCILNYMAIMHKHSLPQRKSTHCTIAALTGEL